MTAKEREKCKKKLVAEAKQRASEDTSGNTYIGFEVPGADENNENSAKILGNENILHNKYEYLNILYTNADGLLNKRHELQTLLTSFNERPHVIAVNEIKPKKYATTVTIERI